MFCYIFQKIVIYEIIPTSQEGGLVCVQMDMKIQETIHEAVSVIKIQIQQATLIFVL